MAFCGSQIAKAYVSFRPNYSSDLINHVLDLIRKNAKNDVTFDVAVDVGCGSGQLTSLLAPFFGKVVGTDVSQNQIQEAKRKNQHSNVEFRVCSAEELNFDDSSVDLLTAAHCAHWFDEHLFNKEAFKILKPTGHLVVLFYQNAPNLHVRNDEELSRKLTQIYREADVFFMENGYMFTPTKQVYTDIKYTLRKATVDFQNKIVDSSFVLRKTFTVDNLVGYLSSMSYFHEYLRQTGDEDYLDRLKMKLVGMCNGKEDIEFEASFPVEIIVARNSGD